jgi:hypothetical protein
MTKKSDVLAGYAAGREAMGEVLEGKIRYGTSVAAALGVGRAVGTRYSLPWFESVPVSILAIVLLALLFMPVEACVKRAIHERRQHHS